MKFKYWILTRKPITPKPVKWYRKGLRLRRVPVYLREMPVVYWLMLKDVVMKVEAAPYLVAVFLDISTEQVENMKAEKVISLYNHVKFQVEKCNQIFENISNTLLQISDGVDRSHLEGKENILIIYDLSEGDILKAEKIEQLSFIQIINWLHAKYLHIRTDQNRYIKDKQNQKK